MKILSDHNSPVINLKSLSFVIINEMWFWTSNEDDNLENKQKINYFATDNVQ